MAPQSSLQIPAGSPPSRLSQRMLWVLLLLYLWGPCFLPSAMTQGCVLRTHCCSWSQWILPKQPNYTNSQIILLFLSRERVKGIKSPLMGDYGFPELPNCYSDIQRNIKGRQSCLWAAQTAISLLSKVSRGALGVLEQPGPTIQELAPEVPQDWRKKQTAAELHKVSIIRGSSWQMYGPGWQQDQWNPHSLNQKERYVYG